MATMSDNGRGLHGATPGDRVGADGLDNMRRRLQQLGGRCELATAPGEGTTVTFKVPLSGPAARRGHNSIEVL
jgi:signal transduction histidine kinase